MNGFDVKQDIVLDIYDNNQEYTLMEVDVPHLGKKLEVKIPNNVEVGHRIRIKGYGYQSAMGTRGDLYLIIADINDMRDTLDAVIVKEKRKKVIQKLMMAKDGDFYEVNQCLENGWKVVDFKPVKMNNTHSYDTYTYILLEKQ
ncbi:MAG: DnaJ C-terminal domain-containing protein [Anaerobutyricum hallii]|uniref:DnaJ C-terminal domain-containing protein n=1 Tax=Anaerobutyricum hallii TaxID=39488 RepID=UPI0024325524|nr:DnaJ C-terminal domain-containing protein [Anaerobutyricum hallii]MDD6590175.1 DnaJ C-terminal domain-containing protein [Anaerobutyricum hallii]